MAQQRSSRSVFVGNIPYDATEEQIKQICEQVGPVLSFRLVMDKETGKAKGYGFCEYRDEETAESARRNLQRYEINGRYLRVDFAESASKGPSDRNVARTNPLQANPLQHSVDHPQPHQAQPLGHYPTHPQVPVQPQFAPPVGYSVASSAALSVASALGAPAPSNGLDSSPGPDALTTQLAGMSRQQLYDLLAQMKVLIQTNHAQARSILMANPQLAKGLFQAQVMLGMVKPIPAQPQVAPAGIHASTVQSTATAQPSPSVSVTAQHQQTAGMPAQHQLPVPMPAQPQASQSRYQPPPVQAPQQVPYQLPAQQPIYSNAQAQQQATTYPSVPPVSYQAQQMQPAPMPSQFSQPAIDLEQQKILLQQVLQLTPDQINSLPPEQKAQVLQLQQALGT